MIVDSFKNRLKKAMSINNMRPIDLANKTGLNKSLISCYLSGRYEAKQDKIYILAKALNVSEAWLLGYDIECNIKNDLNNDYSELDEVLFSKAKDLSEEDKKMIIGIINAIKRDVDKEENN